MCELWLDRCRTLILLFPSCSWWDVPGKQPGGTLTRWTASAHFQVFVTKSVFLTTGEEPSVSSIIIEKHTDNPPPPLEEQRRRRHSEATFTACCEQQLQETSRTSYGTSGRTAEDRAGLWKPDQRRSKNQNNRIHIYEFHIFTYMKHPKLITV